MRLGVLDIGSNTGHLLVVDAHGGAAPLPAYSHKEPLRLAEHLDESDEAPCRRAGIEALDRVHRRSAASSPRTRAARTCSAFATSAVRDAGNSDAVLDHVPDETGVRSPCCPARTRRG